MKKCPYCAEEIQDDAIKCKHCKEWFRGKEANKQSDSTPESDPQSQLSLTDQSEQIVEIPKHISSIVTVDEEDEDESKYVSVKPKGKYGWGWFIFFVIYANSHNPAFSTQITFYNPAISLIENFYFVPLLLIYFWFRNRFLKKLTLGQKRWPAGLKAGILVYLIWIVLIVPTGIIDTKLKNADIKEIGQKYYEKAN